MHMCMYYVSVHIQTPEFLCVLAKGTTFAKHTSPRHNVFFLKQVRLCQMPVYIHYYSLITGITGAALPKWWIYMPNTYPYAPCMEFVYTHIGSFFEALVGNYSIAGAVHPRSSENGFTHKWPNHSVGQTVKPRFSDSLWDPGHFSESR